LLFAALTGFAAILVLAAVAVIAAFRRFRITDRILGQDEMVKEAMAYGLRVARSRSIGKIPTPATDSLRTRLLEL
jgi:hypothetical protein